MAPLYSTEPSTPKDDFSCKSARFIGREESSDQAYVFWHACATERRDGLVVSELDNSENNSMAKLGTYM